MVGKIFAEIKVVYVKKLPVIIVDKNMQIPIVRLVEQILAAKAANPAAEVSAWEREIDQHVYQLYGLTEAEVALVEG
jgi:hypothetical protein